MRIESERFILRKIHVGDIDDLFELESNPEVHMFIGNKPLENKSDVMRVIDYIHSQYDEFGIGRLAIEDKITGECVGWSGLKYETMIREKPYYDIGYRLKQKHWGKGIATETAIAAVQYGINTLGFKEICGAAAVDNYASNRVLQKTGLQLTETFIFDDTPHNWYVIHAESFE